MCPTRGEVLSHTRVTVFSFAVGFLHFTVNLPKDSGTAYRSFPGRYWLGMRVRNRISRFCTYIHVFAFGWVNDKPSTPFSAACWLLNPRRPRTHCGSSRLLRFKVSSPQHATNRYRLFSRPPLYHRFRSL